MHFDYLIVLVFAAAGAALVVASRVRAAPSATARPPEAPRLATRTRDRLAVLAYLVFAAGAVLLLPCALVLHDCLRDSGPAQSRGIGASAVLAGGLFVLILLLGFAHFARKSAPPADDGT